MRTGGEAEVLLLGENLPNDRLVVDLDVREALSEPFAVTVTFSTMDHAFRFEPLLRQRLSATAVDGTGRRRVFDGIVEQASFVGARGRRLVFQLVLGPRISSLRWRQGCRIYQELSVPDIVRSVLDEAGVGDDVDWRLRQVYEPRVFCTQYRETELDFIHRLLEDEGIHYFFLHNPDGHTLVFADEPGAFGADDEPLVLSAIEGAGSAPLGRIGRKLSLRRTNVHLRDYDLEKPALPPESVASAAGPIPLSAYAYPGGFTSGDEAKRKAQARLNADRADADVVRGSTPAVGVVPGGALDIDGAPDEFLEGSFVVTKLVTTAGPGQADDPEARATSIETSFEAVPKGAHISPTRKTPRPRIRGLQTARVTGPSHEEQAIHVDRLGRIKVRFLWDRAGKNDDTTSCWLRVSQVHLGGSMIHPRVGWEVTVAFMDGDPDRPYVVGRLYDAEHPPARPMPAAAAETSIQSAVTPGAAGMNAIHLGDGAGGQSFGISAQKDMNTVVGDSRTETIAGNESIAVATNMNVNVTGADTQTVSGNQEISIGDAQLTKVGAAQSITIGGNENIGTVANMNEHGATRTESISGGRTTISNGVRDEITGALSRDIGSVQVHLAAAGVVDECSATYDETASAVIVHLVGGSHVEQVGGAKTLESTAAELHVASGYAQSAASVTQLVGGARVRLVSGDLAISAPTILLGGGAGHFIAGGSSIKLNGGPITIKTSAVKLDAPVINKSGGSLKLG